MQEFEARIDRIERSSIHLNRAGDRMTAFLITLALADLVTLAMWEAFQ